VSSTLSIPPESLSSSPSDRRAAGLLADLGAVIGLAVCALVLHRDGLLGGPAFYELDTRLFYFPLAQWVSQQLHASVFPLWQPDIFTGYPIFADGELGLAYVPQLALLSLLSAPIAMVWLRVLHVFLAGLFTFLFLRTLRLDPLAAMGGALVFAFGSFLTAQMHHENVIRSAVWLPAVLLCLERSLFRPPRSTFIWAAIGALAFAQSALGLHVQPVLMLALTVALYALFRALVPSNNGGASTRNAYVPLVSVVAIVGGGLALAAVQWVPLGEWALVSSRRGGVTYEFASAFGLAPQGLISLLFPYFYRLPDATTWWSLWQQWEIELYVGIPTLALMVVGIVFSRRAELLFFVPLAALALLVAMGSDSPTLNLHEWLWSVPGFSFLRAPGRFTYLVVFASACIAGFGIQALRQRRVRLLLALVGGVPSAALLAASLAFLPAWQSWLASDPARAEAYVDAAYLSTRAQYPIDPQTVIDGAVASLSLTNPKTAWSLVLLALTTAGFVVWAGLGYRRATLAQGLFVGLVALDLLTFAYDFHPRAPMSSLTPALPVGLAPGARVVLRDSVDVPDLEPNQLLTIGLPTIHGYSSLPSQRHVEVEAATSTQPGLIDLWSAPTVVEPAAPADLHEVNGVTFRAQHPLATVVAAAPPVTFNVPPSIGTVLTLRLVGTLDYAFDVTQGDTVATITLDGGALTLPIRAGVELSERAFDRPSLAGLVRHHKGSVALDFDEATPEGEAYVAHLYQAVLALPAPTTMQTVTISAAGARTEIDIHGLALVDGNGTAHSLTLAERDGFRRVAPDVIEDTRALPRAFVLPRTQSYSPARHPSMTATQVATNADADPHTSVLIEGNADTAREPVGSTPAVAAEGVQDLGPNVVWVTATATEPSYLVLNDFYHRGWTATVDGQSTPVDIANALFRAVAIEPGTHVVEFRFEPRSMLIGGLISVLAVVGVLAMVGIGLLRWRG
jgi:hypothetical protein